MPSSSYRQTTMSDPVIEVEGLTKVFGDFTAVDHISFDVERGEIFGFLGANGAGKSARSRRVMWKESPKAYACSTSG